MIAEQVAQRYSKALFRMGRTEKKQQLWRGTLEKLAMVFDKSDRLRHFIQAPHITISEKKKLLKGCLGSYVDKELWHFIEFLVEKRRFIFLPEIAFSYALLVNESRTTLEATVTTAIAMPSKFKKRVVGKLSEFYAKKIILNEVVDPLIGGGLTLTIGNRLFDWSTIDRLKTIKEKLLASAIP